MVKAEFIGISSFGSPLRRSLRGLRLRTEMTLRDIPVFRSAYFPKRPFGLFSKTLDLQVRFAHPPVGGGS